MRQRDRGGQRFGPGRSGGFAEGLRPGRRQAPRAGGESGNRRSPESRRRAGAELGRRVAGIEFRVVERPGFDARSRHGRPAPRGDRGGPGDRGRRPAPLRGARGRRRARLRRPRVGAEARQPLGTWPAAPGRRLPHCLGLPHPALGPGVRGKNARGPLHRPRRPRMGGAREEGGLAPCRGPSGQADAFARRRRRPAPGPRPARPRSQPDPQLLHSAQHDCARAHEPSARKVADPLLLLGGQVRGVQRLRGGRRQGAQENAAQGRRRRIQRLVRDAARRRLGNRVSAAAGINSTPRCGRRADRSARSASSARGSRSRPIRSRR